MHAGCPSDKIKYVPDWDKGPMHACMEMWLLHQMLAIGLIILSISNNLDKIKELLDNNVDGVKYKKIEKLQMNDNDWSGAKSRK
jgi:type III secretory pathway lipoprotein EscJ